MNVYTFSHARQNLADVLKEALSQGHVRIRRRDGTEFEIAPVQQRSAPLDVPSLGLDLSADEIVSALREVRQRG
jgi:hypothetical protein